MRSKRRRKENREKKLDVYKGGMRNQGRRKKRMKNRLVQRRRRGV